MHQLSPTDASFFQLETPKQPMVVGALWICDQDTAPGGLVRHKQILEYVGDRISHSTLFRRRLQEVPLHLDDPYWIDDANFNLEYHIRHVGLPKPGDLRQLRIFTARIMSRSMDMDRAPWELYIIEGLEDSENFPENSFAVLLRMHHAYVDGKSAVELMSMMLESTPNHHYGERNHEQFAEPALSPTETWARTAPRLTSQLFRSAKASVKFARKSYELYNRLRDDALPDQQHIPETIFNQNISPQRVYGSVNWNYHQLKNISRLAPNASINDAIIAIVGGGMKRYLDSAGELPAGESLVALCPVSVRSTKQKKALGNMVSGMLIGIGTDIDDPVKRLEKIQSRTSRAIPLAQEVIGDLVTSWGEMVPPVMRAAVGWAQGKLHLLSKTPLINTVITNVPGPSGLEPRYFVGAQITRIYPLIPNADGVALTHGITGIGTELALGITCDRAIMPDMDHYLACIEESTQEYLALAQ